MLYQKIILKNGKLLICIGILFAMSLMLAPQALLAQDDPLPSVRLASSSELNIDVNGDGEASIGDTLLYRITATNDSNATATGIRFLSKLDEHLTLIDSSITSSQGSVRLGGFVQVELGELAAGESATIEFQAVIDAGSAAGQVRTTTQVSFNEDNRPPEETGGLSQGETLVVTPIQARQIPSYMIYLPFIDAGLSR